jgi:hypothetical protein
MTDTIATAVAPYAAEPAAPAPKQTAEDFATDAIDVLYYPPEPPEPVADALPEPEPEPAAPPTDALDSPKPMDGEIWDDHTVAHVTRQLQLSEQGFHQLVNLAQQRAATRARDIRTPGEREALNADIRHTERQLSQMWQNLQLQKTAAAEKINADNQHRHGQRKRDAESTLRSSYSSEFDVDANVQYMRRRGYTDVEIEQALADSRIMRDINLARKYGKKRVAAGAPSYVITLPRKKASAKQQPKPGFVLPGKRTANDFYGDTPEPLLPPARRLSRDDPARILYGDAP